MKIILMCPSCGIDGLQLKEDKSGPVFPEVELDQWPLFYEYTCKNGHQNVHTIQTELYELLFQQGTYCIMDGYYREAIGTYNAALERFFEYVIEIIFLTKNHNLEFEKLWKEVRNQSERQLGAFYFLWSYHFGESPQFLDTNKVSIRNNVIHKGQLVSKKEAKEFGQYIFSYIRGLQNKLNELLGEELMLSSMARNYRLLEPKLSKISPDQIIVNSSIPNFLNSENIKNLDDCFKEENQHQMGYGLLI